MVAAAVQTRFSDYFGHSHSGCVDALYALPQVEVGDSGYAEKRDKSQEYARRKEPHGIECGAYAEYRQYCAEAFVLQGQPFLCRFYLVEFYVLEYT